MAWLGDEIAWAWAAMLVSYSDRCAECAGKMADLEEELVCTSCGRVSQKEVIDDMRSERSPQAMDYTKYSLGSYLGPMDYGDGSNWSGFSKSSSTFRYLKLISDHSCRDEGAVYSCAKMIERVSERLGIPKTAIGQSMSIAKVMMEKRKQRGGFTIAAISAFSIITACKLYGITTVGVREVIRAHEELGHRVKTSTMISMAIESPVRPMARSAEEYLGRVIARLASNRRLTSNLRNEGRSETAYCQRLAESARTILERVDVTSRGGHSPCALAATSVYAAEIKWSKAESRKKFFTQSDIAECAGVAEYTVREQYGELFRRLMKEAEAEVTGESRSRAPTTRTAPILLGQLAVTR